MKNYLCLIFVLVFCSCELDPDFEEVIIVDATISELSISSNVTGNCNAPCVINFDATAKLNNPNSTIDLIEYEWDFGDNSAITFGTSVSHTFAKEGMYTVEVMASAPNAQEVMTSIIVNVSAANSFITTVQDLNSAFAIEEVSDGYLAFSLDEVIKFDNNGAYVDAIRLTGFANFNYIGHLSFEQDQFLVASMSGDHLTVDKDLNITNEVTTVLSQSESILGLVKINSTPYFISYDFLSGILEPRSLLEIGFSRFFLPDYVVEQFSVIDNQVYPGPRIYQTDDFLYFSAKSTFDDSDGIVSYQLIGSDGYNVLKTDRFIPLLHAEDKETRSIVSFGLSEGDNPALKMKRFADNGIIFIDDQELTLCVAGQTPIDVFNVDDGYILLSVVSQGAICVSDDILGPTDIYVQKLDKSLNLIWSSIVPLENEQHAFSIQQDSDGGYLIGGRTLKDDAYQLLFVKMDPNGEI